MDIIRERISREFNIELIATAPSVKYHVYLTNGEMIEISNPADLPAPNSVRYIEEPYVTATIMSPAEYIGAIMELCQKKRGTFIDMKYLEETRVSIHYDMPLLEIVYDFFDKLKSYTKGYASLDYEIGEYKESNLVKMDIMLNGDTVDALSMIVHRDFAYPRGKQMVEKLKELIPRQLFEVPVQAVIGNKVIARSDIKAMRKDVLAKCYGGDISRKKKLLEKQKEGKKKMKAIGSVEVPQEAFLAVLKTDEE
jgi:GTP-binding protein LepA